MGFMIAFIIFFVFCICLGAFLAFFVFGVQLMGTGIKKISKGISGEVKQYKTNTQKTVGSSASPQPAIDPYLIIPPILTTENVIKSNIRQNKKRKAAHSVACLTADENDSPHPPEPKMLPVTADEIEALRAAQLKQPLNGQRPRF